MLVVIVIAVALFIASRPDAPGEGNAALEGALKGAIPKATRGLNDPAPSPAPTDRGLNNPVHEEAAERYELKIPDPEPEVTMKGRA